MVVEDDASIGDPLVRALRREDYEVEHVGTGEAALERLHAASFDLVVLDIGLPGIDGVEVCRRIRRDHGATAVLMLTARSSELDEVVGLDAGADDYVTKPFGLAVLTARVRALLRRRSAPDVGDSVIEVSGLRIDQASRRAWRGPRELELAPKEFDLLAALAARAGVPSDPVRSSFGWHVILVRPYEEVADDLRAATAEDPGAALLDGLLATADITVDSAYGRWNPAAGRVDANT